MLSTGTNLAHPTLCYTGKGRRFTRGGRPSGQGRTWPSTATPRKSFISRNKSMKIYHQSKFGTAPHELLYSGDISLKAKGLYTYMQAKPDGWEFSADRIANECKEGKDAIQAALAELVDNGWLIRQKWHNEDGLWTWEHTLVSIMAQNNDSSPERGFPSTDNPALDNPAIYKERDTKKENCFSAKNDFYEDETIEAVDDNGDPIKPRTKATKDPLIEFFRSECKKQVGINPVIPIAASRTLLITARQHLTDTQITAMFKDWFALGKPDNETMQITRALSTARINTFKADNGIK